MGGNRVLVLDARCLAERIAPRSLDCSFRFDDASPVRANPLPIRSAIGIPSEGLA